MIQEDSRVSLEVFDISGKRLDILFKGNANAEELYRVVFDGSHLPNGMLFYKLQTEQKTVYNKAILSR